MTTFMTPKLSNSIPSIPTTLSAPFLALTALAKAEEDFHTGVSYSRVSWFVDVFRIKGSTIGRVWKPVSIITIFSALVAVVDLVYGTDVNLSNNVVPLLSVVVGLLLVFRNQTAYARWDDGRKSFGTTISTVRNLARLTWVNVGPPHAVGRINSEGKKVSSLDVEYGDDDRRKKRKALRLMVAFVVAAKHHVRGEYGIDYDDLKHLLPTNFPVEAGYGYDSCVADYPSATVTHTGNQTPTSRRSSRRPSDVQPLSHSAHFSQAPTETAPLLDHETVLVHNAASRPSLPLPLIIAQQLQLYFAACKRKGLLESIGPAGLNTMTSSVSALVDQMGHMERLKTLGIPYVYGIHLKQSVTLFLMALPFVLVEALSWKMIPFLTIIAFNLIGIEGIASEIEMPFGKDASDLPLDLLCAELRNEIEHLMARLPEDPDAFDAAF